jgi:hypothetical protein
MDTHWVNDRPGYRCPHGHTSAMRPAGPATGDSARLCAWRRTLTGIIPVMSASLVYQRLRQIL